jgi:hypothetical protein
LYVKVIPPPLMLNEPYAPQLKDAGARASAVTLPPLGAYALPRPIGMPPPSSSCTLVSCDSEEPANETEQPCEYVATESSVAD